MFIAHNVVRMHDTDMAGILYFARIYRFAHDALEDFMEYEGIRFQEMFRGSDFAFVIVHSEADYRQPLTVGDKLDVHVLVEKVGTSSFTMGYKIYRSDDHELVGTAKTVHVTLDPKTRSKIHIPEKFRVLLHNYHQLAQHSEHKFE